LLARSSGYNSGTGAWNTHYEYYADGNGNIVNLTDASQAVAASYEYDPYGNLLSSSGTMAGANVYRFSSKEYHAASGLYYYLYRWYDPQTQRWLNRDPLGTGMVRLSWRGLKSRPFPGELLVGPNLYEYCLNDPINHTDPDGRIIVPVLIIGAAVLAGWGLWEFADAIKNAQKNAEIGAHNREMQNEAISNPRTSYCPTRDKAVGGGLKDMLRTSTKWPPVLERLQADRPDFLKTQETHHLDYLDWCSART
jgi:RHS repeat-associated protein